MNSANDPLVSIGMPVYNGEKYLRGALNSLLAQDYSRFELIISDNNSHDATESICREFQASDPRIRYIRQSENQGAPWNFKFVVEEARGEYFMWAAHDDLWDPSYLGKCLRTLRSRDGAVLCCTEVNFIDAEGNPSPYLVGFKNLDTEGMPPVRRIHALIARMGWYAAYGLMPTEAIRSAKAFGRGVFGFDVIFTLELMLMGEIAKVHEPLFFYRIVKPKTAADFQADFNSESKPEAPTPIPYTELATNLLKVVYRSALSPEEKLAAFADFLCTLSSPAAGWRNLITRELLGPSAALNDAAFAFILGQILGRSVPLREIKSNPLLQAVYWPPQVVPDLLIAARNLLDRISAKSHLENGKRELAAQLYQQGKLEEASRAYGEALLERETSDRWTDWATVQLARKRTEEAEIGLRRALELDGGNTLAALKLGTLMANLGRFESAIPFLEMSAATLPDPRRSEVLQLIAECQTRLNSVAS
ncbi:MAG TPA: glycosyltransferase [Terriglobia bacterium]|nr:glycosyltransferase [Terriglobia bacterium]